MMNIRNIDLNLLHIFIVVYECKSITRAADKLHLSQPAVSNALTRLKTTLNQALFVNRNRKIVATTLADDLYREIKPCLKKIESSLSQIKTFEPANSKRIFRIASNNYGDLALFPELIPYLQREAPYIKVKRLLCPEKDFNQQLLHGKLDLVMFFDFHASQGIRKEFLFGDSMVLVTGINHSGIPTNPTINEVIGMDIIGHGEGYNEYVPLFHQMDQQEEFYHPRLEIESIWSILNVVATTDLVAVIPGFFAKKVADYMPIKIYNIACAEDALKIFLYWPDVEAKDSAHCWFRELVKEKVITEKNRID